MCRSCFLVAILNALDHLLPIFTTCVGSAPHTASDAEFGTEIVLSNKLAEFTDAKKRRSPAAVGMDMEVSNDVVFITKATLSFSKSMTMCEETVIEKQQGSHPVYRLLQCRPGSFIGNLHAGTTWS